MNRLLIFGFLFAKIVDSLPFCESKEQIAGAWNEAVRRHLPTERPQFYISSSLTFNFHWLLEHELVGNPMTLVQLLDLLNDVDCPLTLSGHVVPTLLLRSPSDFVTIGRVMLRTACEMEKIYETCRAQLGDSICNWSGEKNECVLVGNPFALFRFEAKSVSLEICSVEKPTDEILFASLEMGIFDNLAGKTILMDFYGNGVESTCNRSIRTITKHEDFERLVFQSSILKSVRVAELFALDFNYSNLKLQEALESSWKKEMNKTFLAQYYCTQFYDGFWIANDEVCKLPWPSNESTKRRLHLLQQNSPRLFSILENAFEQSKYYVQFEDRRPILSSANPKYESKGNRALGKKSSGRLMVIGSLALFWRDLFQSF